MSSSTWSSDDEVCTPLILRHHEMLLWCSQCYALAILQVLLYQVLVWSSCLQLYPTCTPRHSTTGSGVAIGLTVYSIPQCHVVEVVVVALSSHGSSRHGIHGYPPWLWSTRYQRSRGQYPKRVPSDPVSLAVEMSEVSTKTYTTRTRGYTIEG